MGYIERNLLPGENLIYRTTLHWGIFLPGCIVSLLGAIGLVYALVQWGAGVLAAAATGLLILGLVFLFRAWVIWHTSEFGVSNQRVIIKMGLLRRRTLEILLHQVEAISITETLMGRLFRFGTVVITGAGGTSECFPSVHDPFAFRQAVQSRMVEERTNVPDSPGQREI